MVNPMRPILRGLVIYCQLAWNIGVHILGFGAINIVNLLYYILCMPKSHPLIVSKQDEFGFSQTFNLQCYRCGFCTQYQIVITYFIVVGFTICVNEYAILFKLNPVNLALIANAVPFTDNKFLTVRLARAE